MGALELYIVYLGERLGLYRALAEDRSATSSELAERTGTIERYVSSRVLRRTGIKFKRVTLDPLETGERLFGLGRSGKRSRRTLKGSETTTKPLTRGFAAGPDF